MKAKILEIFSSIQGEGKYAGAKQAFVRFFECNMHCVWCDTPYSIGSKAMRKDVLKKFPQGSVDRYKELNITDIWAQVQLLGRDIHSVSLTGGEPLIQKEAVKEFAGLLKLNGIKSYLETNGILPDALKDVIDVVDIIAMDFKLPSSTKTKPFWQEHEDFLKIAIQKDVFIKAVVTSGTDKEDILKAARLAAKVDPGILFILQPNFFELSNGVVKKCVSFQELCSRDLQNVRVMPQMHKFLKLR